MEYPHLVALYHQYKDRGFEIYSIDTTNRPQMSKEFTTSVGADFTIVMDDQDVAGKVFDVHATPTNLFIDRDGMMMFRTVGFSPGMEKTFAATVEHLLSKKTELGMVNP